MKRWDSDEVYFFFKYGISPDDYSGGWQQALHIAINDGHSRLASMALENGAKANAPGPFFHMYHTIFNRACALGHTIIYSCGTHVAHKTEWKGRMSGYLEHYGG
jgi:hypothetical protein